MEIARKVTSDLSEGEITRLSEVINEAMYEGREPIEKVSDIFLSYGDALNFIMYEGGDAVGVAQIRYLEKANSFYFKVGAVDKEHREKGAMSKTINLCIDHVKQSKAEYAGVCSSNPCVIEMFRGKGFPLPVEMGIRQGHLLGKAKQILFESKGSDLGLSDMFILPFEKFDTPPVSGIEDAHSEAVGDFVKNYMRPGDRLFMIKKFDY